MPLSDLQIRTLRLLAAHRDPESDVAGSVWLTRGAARYSDDIAICHDREERVAGAAEDNVAALRAAGMEVEWQRREPLFYRALVNAAGASTRLEWAADSDFRFYPTQRDPDFGTMLHPADLATNKMMAATGRREPRDIVDLIYIHHRMMPLGAVAWAAVGRSLGFTPEGLINEVRRLARYTEADFERVASEPPIDAAQVMRRRRQVLNDADAFVRRMPTDKVGLLFLMDGRPVQPDPDRLDTYLPHAGARRGHWPSSVEIGSVMLERHHNPAP